MSKTSGIDARLCVDEAVIELGVASIETMGGGIPGGEELGETVPPGISDK